MATKLLDEVAAAEAGTASKAREVYVEVLGRSDDPRQGDAARLQEAMRVLGLTAADAARDAGVLKQAAALEATAAGKPAAKAARIAADKAVNAPDEAWAKAKREHDKRRLELLATSIAAAAAERQCRSGAESLAALQQRNYALFGLPKPPAPPEDRTGRPGQPGIGQPVPIRQDSGTVPEPPRRVEQGVFHRAATAEQK